MKITTKLYMIKNMKYLKLLFDDFCNEIGLSKTHEEFIDFVQTQYDIERGFIK